jgi:CRP/FNR family transcriptional regulator/CRP/FNR family cyclic AMP-dependent transcriptional regulator
MKAEVLKTIPLLSKLEDEELERLAEVVISKKARRGSYLMHTDDPGASLMFVVEGSLKVTLMGTDGKEVVLALLNQGDFFGEISVLTGEDRSANVVALTDSLLAVLDKNTFEQHILAHTGLSHALLRAMALRLKAASAKIGDLTLLDVYRRIARTLQNLAIPTNTEEPGGPRVIEKRPTHQELAGMAGTSREMVTRALKALEEDGHITVDGKTVTVLSVPL